jgi:hypothetical protein
MRKTGKRRRSLKDSQQENRPVVHDKPMEKSVTCLEFQEAVLVKKFV